MGGPACWGLIVSMKGGERLSLEQIRAFVEASGEVEFQARDQISSLMASSARCRSQTKKGDPTAGSLVLQAHSSMRKCFRHRECQTRGKTARAMKLRCSDDATGSRCLSKWIRLYLCFQAQNKESRDKERSRLGILLVAKLHYRSAGTNKYIQSHEIKAVLSHTNGQTDL